MKQEIIFLVGCPRSGTTWVQLLLCQHPEIATLQESHLFADYIGPALDRWRHEDQQKRGTGLTKLMPRDQFIELWRHFAEQTLRVALVDKPDASFILEKTPDHLYYAREILELFPTAYFVHVIRDPRAVVASLLDAGRSWAKTWAPQSSLPAAQMWRNAVLRGRQIQQLTARYAEVSYEKMLTEPEAELARLLGNFRLEASQSFCRRAVEACSAANSTGGIWKGWLPKSMENIKGQTVRKGQADGWKSELSRFQIGTVEYVAKDVLNTFGYEPLLKPGLVVEVRLTLKRVLSKFCDHFVRHVRDALPRV